MMQMVGIPVVHTLGIPVAYTAKVSQARAKHSGELRELRLSSGKQADTSRDAPVPFGNLRAELVIKNDYCWSLKIPDLVSISVGSPAASGTLVAQQADTLCSWPAPQEQGTGCDSPASWQLLLMDTS